MGASSATLTLYQAPKNIRCFEQTKTHSSCESERNLPQDKTYMRGKSWWVRSWCPSEVCQGERAGRKQKHSPSPLEWQGQELHRNQGHRGRGWRCETNRLGGTWQPIGLTTHHVGAISGSRKLLNCLRLRFANIGKGLGFRNQNPNLGEEAWWSISDPFLRSDLARRQYI